MWLDLILCIFVTLAVALFLFILIEGSLFLFRISEDRVEQVGSTVLIALSLGTTGILTWALWDLWVSFARGDYL